MKFSIVLLFLLTFMGCHVGRLTSAMAAPDSTDPVAERMLLYQRSNGGWPQDDGDDVAYDEALTEAQRAAVLADKSQDDTTFDDESTTREITYLLGAHQRTDNPAYLKAASMGIDFILSAQYANGGFPQEYPDTSGYHGHITYNDNVTIDLLTLLRKVSEGKAEYAALPATQREAAGRAVENGINSILATQYVHAGKLTAWGAQHDRNTLAPAPARAFEPVSLSGKESVEIVRFLMEVPQPGEDIREAVRAAVEWLDAVRIDGYRQDRIEAPDQPTGRDRIIVADSSSTIWGRFYEIGTWRPIFIGRDGIIKYELKDIENERRTGYGFYGHWAKDLIKKEYPSWEERIAG
ncbi:pectate lyase [Neolewinella xylanilytica]|uniref:pectate lyase n=1 Tax=Neolewinella xylanilytica TaxID=1514080 RepID=UPI001B7FF40B|nr:pectate lyase [Neolewinella xylanilytica]